MDGTTAETDRTGHRRHWLWAAAGLTTLIAAVLYPLLALETLRFVLWSFLTVLPMVIPGILLSAWVGASGIGGRLSERFSRNSVVAVLTASAIGAVTPVCGVTVLPLMTGLLAAGVPLAPVMAFWLSSPVTDPAMLAATAALLGVEMAIAKTLAAFLLGLLGGTIVAALAGRAWIAAPLRSVGPTGTGCQEDGDGAVVWRVWQAPDRRRRFLSELWSMTRLIVFCLTPAFAAEHLLQQVLAPDALAAYLGGDSALAVPLAVLVGAPAYLDGYAALPLTRSLMEHGMSPGAALAFLVSGGAVSIWGAMAIAPVLRLRPFLLYLALAVAGSLAVGYLYDLLA